MTRKQHLKKLPLQKRLQAMENIRKLRHGKFSYALNENTSKSESLEGAFIFSDSKQGYEYWRDIYTKYFSDEQ